jgi:uncharacterized membrane protein YbhN (UPF0104 family)
MGLLRFLRAHPVAATATALVLAPLGVMVMALVVGWSSFVNAWSEPRWGWLALVFGAEVLAIAAYAFAYGALVRYEGGPSLKVPLLLRIVLAGFAPLTPRGGFALDKRALHAIGGDRDEAMVRVLGLGTLEWALLAPAACISAAILLAVGDPRPMRSLLWPWVVAVPIGFAIGFWLASPSRRERISGRLGNRHLLVQALRGVDMVRRMAHELSICWVAWLAAALYWVLDIGSFYAATRFVNLHLGAAETILAYATGYALTRRSMPLGGAVATEVLLTLALHWVGVPLAPALAAVVVYRGVNFVLPAIIALAVIPGLDPLLAAAGQGRTSAEAKRIIAAGVD